MMRRGFLSALLFICILALSGQSGKCDGYRVCYASSGGIYELFIRDTSTGATESRRLKLFDLHLHGLSGDSCTLIGRDLSTNAIYFLSNSGLWRLKSSSASKILPDVDDAILSGTGDSLAFERSGSVEVVDTKTLTPHFLTINSFDPCWASRSNRIAYAMEPVGNSNDAPVVVANPATGRIFFKTPCSVNPCNPVLSPTGRFLAVDFHLSRPVTGDVIFDTRTGETLSAASDMGRTDAFTPSQYLPGLVEDWSPDSKWILWDWRTPDPNNDGSWLGDNVGLTSLTGSFRTLLGHGKDARFSPDGRQVLFLLLRPETKNVFDLMLSNYRSDVTVCLANDVVSYITFK